MSLRPDSGSVSPLRDLLVGPAPRTPPKDEKSEARAKAKEARAKRPKAPFDLVKLLDASFNCRVFQPEPEIGGRIAIPSHWDRGISRLVLVQGENAGGKSFFRKVIRTMTHRDEGDFPVKEVVHLSMAGRTDTGLVHDPIVRAMIYGDEQNFATGVNSANIVCTAISTVTGRNHDVILYLDEPDIGMSASGAAGLGAQIREFVDKAPKHVVAVFISTHSPALVSQLLKAKEQPHYVCLGDVNPPKTAHDWVKQQINPDIEPRAPENISKVGIERFRDIAKILKD